MSTYVFIMRETTQILVYFSVLKGEQNTLRAKQIIIGVAIHISFKLETSRCQKDLATIS